MFLISPTLKKDISAVVSSLMFFMYVNLPSKVTPEQVANSVLLGKTEIILQRVASSDGNAFIPQTKFPTFV